MPLLYNNEQLGWRYLSPKLRLQPHCVKNKGSRTHHTWLQMCKGWVPQPTAAPLTAKERRCTSPHNRFPREVRESWGRGVPQEDAQCSPRVSLLPTAVWEGTKGEAGGATAWHQEPSPSPQRAGLGIHLLENIVRSPLICLLP